MKFNSILLHMLICSFFEKAIASQCKAASYSVQDHVLINHVIKAGPAELIEHCISRCIKHPGCHSSNFYRKRGWCELNDKTHASHPEDMKQVPFTHYMANTLRPFTCITHPDCGSNLICSLSKCVECSIYALGMENDLLPNSAITASSVWLSPAGHESWRARLNNVPNGHAGCWAAGNNKVGEWLQIDLRKERLLTKLATQGRPASDQRVTSYNLWFSSDNVKWELYKENGVVKVFTGNSDSNTIVSHVLKAKFTTRYVRIVVQTWYEHISMRVELYGCAES